MKKNERAGFWAALEGKCDEPGVFALDPAKEKQLVAHMKAAELYESAEPKEGVFTSPIDFMRHERCVEVEIDLGIGAAEATVIGADLTHEYVSENADYRS